MPKYDSLEKYWFAKWKGQSQQCRTQREEIRGLKVTIASWMRNATHMNMLNGNSRNEIGDLRKQVGNLTDTVAEMSGIYQKSQMLLAQSNYKVKLLQSQLDGWQKEQ